MNIATSRLSRAVIRKQLHGIYRMSFSRLVRFVPRGDSKAVLLGEPVDQKLDVGIAIREGEDVKVLVFSGTSALDAGKATDKVEIIDRLLCPLTQREVGTIRCIGLNVSVFQ